MQAIDPGRRVSIALYEWSNIGIDPNPPRAGEPTAIDFPFSNSTHEPIKIERIEVGIAGFGIGVPWEQIATLGPLTLLPDPATIVHATTTWTPDKPGHRCVRAHISIQGQPETLMVGRNLDIVRAGAHEDTWNVRFSLGNPTKETAPITLRHAEAPALAGHLWVAGRPLRPQEPLWLRPGEVVEAVVRLRAQTQDGFEADWRLEGFIGETLIDGLIVRVQRQAAVTTGTRPRHPAVPVGLLAYA